MKRQNSSLVDPRWLSYSSRILSVLAHNRCIIISRRHPLVLSLSCSVTTSTLPLLCPFPQWLVASMFSRLQTSSIILSLLFDPASAGLVPQKRADICGSKGYDRGSGNYFYSDSTKLATYAACSQKCVADAKCKSFGYSDSECMFFNIALSGNFDADSGSSDTYYDRGCIKSLASSSSSSFKTTTSLSSSTKTTALPTTSKTTVGSTLTSNQSSSVSKTTASSSQATTTVSESSSATSSGASASATVPAGCSVPSPVSITSFSWFNSTHNLVRTPRAHYLGIRELHAPA